MEKTEISIKRGFELTREIQLGKDMVILDTEKVYSGAENPSDDEKLVRKAVGLPLKKQIIYYKDKRKTNSIIDVKAYQLIEMFNITERWYVVEVTLSDDSKRRIHSSYLVEMQKPSFIADMAAQMA